ncbi:hypothetical protein PEX1_084300 [Penicillium expansum]|nr:hypothetical protein N7453_003062 [Penicillium expansum]KGO45788.1 hypothetical protein PEXP_019110 [Penicillium expansum]KGO68376.1 hypothetical protein PEX1_084300 [Penicillium expansum]
MATLEQKLRAQYTKVIEEKCSNQSSQPQYGNDCEESYRKEKAALEERLQAQCATSQSNAATKCKSEKYTMSEDHRKANKQLEEENERLRKENDKLAQKAKNDQKAKEKLERDNEELEQENKRLKKQDSECAQKAKDDQKAKEELEQENDGLKKEKEKNAQKGKGEQKSKEELEQENDRLKKQEEERAQKAKDDQKAKEDLEQENAKLKKQEEEQAQKAKENQKAKEELEKENDRLKAESRPNQQPNKIASQPNSSESELEAFSKKGCPSLHGERATVLGVTYEAFCGARPRGRHTGDYVNSRNLADCMGACTVDRSCQGVYYETSLGRCQTTMDWEYPPLRWADSGEFSLVPVAPREGGIGTTTPDLPSLLIKDEHKDGASCPDSDGMIVSVGSLQFRVNCRKYQPKKHIEKTGSSGRVSGMLAICALNPACQGVSYWASSVYMIAEHEKLPERTKNSDLVKDYEWVIMLIEPRVAV